MSDTVEFFEFSDWVSVNTQLAMILPLKKQQFRSWAKFPHILREIRPLARYKFASQDLKSVGCGFPEIFFMLLVGKEVLCEGWPARRDTGRVQLS